MLCAQALAVVAQAIDRVQVRGTLDVLYNADDVKRDLHLWARERGHAVRDEGVGRLSIERSR
jgi:hypothetical protein